LSDVDQIPMHELISRLQNLDQTETDDSWQSWLFSLPWFSVILVIGLIVLIYYKCNLKCKNKSWSARLRRDRSEVTASPQIEMVSVKTEGENVASRAFPSAPRSTSTMDNIFRRMYPTLDNVGKNDEDNEQR